MSVMRRSFRILPIALAVATAAALLTAPAASARPASAPTAQIPKGTVIDRSMFGMHVANAEFGTWPNVPVGSFRLWDNRTSWANIEATQGNFDWTNLDNAVATAQAHGVNDILMVLAGTPIWASDDSSPAALPLPGSAGMPKNLAWWDNWVRQVVTRYKGKITAYQPWNEANLSTFSTGSPAEMADLTKRAYDIIKSVDPSATVVAPSTGTRLVGAFKKFYPAFLAELKARNWPVDVWTAHTYPAWNQTPVNRAALAKMWQAELTKAGAPKLPMWDTENNFGLWGPGQTPDPDIEGMKAANYVGRSYLDALRLGVSRVYWYRWEPFNDRWGIQMNTGTPGATAYATLQNWIVGATYKGCSNQGTLVTCKFTKAGAPFQIVYTDSGNAKTFKAGNAKQACNLMGTCSAIRGKKIHTAGPMLLK